MKGFRGWGGQAYEVGVGEHDAKILGCELSKDLESVRMRVRLNQRVGAVLATNEAEGIDEAGLHDGRHSRPPAAAHKVDHARRQLRRERLSCEHVDEATDCWELEHSDVAEEERGDEDGVHFVERVVEGRESQHHANRPAAHAHADAASLAPLSETLADGGIFL